jgi:uncharacterized protein YndB with AHSA1/START domain
VDELSVRVEATLPHAAAEVWAALARPELWWGREAQVELKKGGRYRVRQGKAWLEGKVAALSAGRRLEIEIPVKTANASFDTALEVTLAREGAGTRIAFVHRGPEVMAWMGERRELEKEWRQTLLKLSNYLRDERKKPGPREP